MIFSDSLHIYTISDFPEIIYINIILDDFSILLVLQAMLDWRLKLSKCLVKEASSSGFKFPIYMEDFKLVT